MQVTLLLSRREKPCCSPTPSFRSEAEFVTRPHHAHRNARLLGCQIEAKLQDFITVVVVIPEETLESGCEEREIPDDPARTSCSHQCRQSFRDVRKLVRLIPHEYLIRVTDLGE